MTKMILVIIRRPSRQKKVMDPTPEAPSQYYVRPSGALANTMLSRVLLLLSVLRGWWRR